MRGGAVSNPRKAKGTKFEVEIRGYANQVLGALTTVYRPAQEGHKDVGDLHGVSPFIIQAKNWRDLVAALREGVDGAVKQAGHAGERWGVAVVKRARRPTSDAYAVMRLSDWLEFYREYLLVVEDNRRLRGE